MERIFEAQADTYWEDEMAYMDVNLQGLACIYINDPKCLCHSTVLD